jgi:hypothetical protein
MHIKPQDGVLPSGPFKGCDFGLKPILGNLSLWLLLLLLLWLLAFLRPSRASLGLSLRLLLLVVILLLRPLLLWISRSLWALKRALPGKPGAPESGTSKPVVIIIRLSRTPKLVRRIKVVRALLPVMSRRRVRCKPGTERVVGEGRYRRGTMLSKRLLSRITKEARLGAEARRIIHYKEYGGGW